MTLIKLVFESAVALFIFVAGIKVAVKYPTFAGKISSFLSWAKSKV